MFRYRPALGKALAAALIAAASAFAYVMPAQAASQGDRDLCTKGKGDAAIAACTRIIGDQNESARNRADAYDRRGLAYRGKTDLDRAIADFSEAIRLDPEDAVAYHHRGFTYLRIAYRRKTGDYERAIADYSEAIRIEPENTALLFHARPCIPQERRF